MATNTFLLRFKTGNGSYTLYDLSSDSTVKSLKKNLEKATNIRSETMKFLSGYPPKPLLIANDNMKLCEVNISSGDTLIVDVIKQPIREEKEDFTADLMEQSGIMIRHAVPSNNSCLFASVYFILHEGLNMEKCNELRKVIATAVANNPEKYSIAVLEKSNEEYCKWIQNTTHWGGAIELAILSDHFKIEIVVLDAQSLMVLRYGENNNYRERLFLIYDGIHYDPLVMEFENHREGIFLTKDPKPLELAYELVKEAHGIGDYVDTKNFMLRCGDCNQILKGEVEAAEHALNTSHKNFVQRK